MSFEPALDEIVPQDVVEMARRVQTQLASGVKSLPPGRTFVWYMGPADSLIPGDKSVPAPELSLVITANGPHGPIPTSSYTVSLEDLRMQIDRTTGIALLEKPLNGLGKQLETVNRNLDRIVKLLPPPKDE